MVFLVGLDRFSKYLAIKKNHYLCNEDMAWGVSMPFKMVIIAAIILIMVFLFWQKVKKRFTSFQQLFFFVLILSGALSNFWDRWSYGCVIDFINIDFFNFPWFNFADSFILLGVMGWFYTEKTLDY